MSENPNAFPQTAVMQVDRDAADSYRRWFVADPSEPNIPLEVRFARHRIDYAPGTPKPDSRWAPWGGEYNLRRSAPPELDDEQLVEVLRRNGRVTGPYPVGKIEWFHQSVDSDIMFYREIPQTKEGI